ncbi:flagellar hook capping FlgD N-terminal domain-containing protein [Hydrogenimonas sp.]
MDVTNTLNPSKSTFSAKNDIVSNPKAVLGKDDFMKLLLTELQYQDPTNPMDSEKMLTQTSQLATLEASDNTNKALESLSKTLTQSASLSVISAIGNMATLQNDSILLGEDGNSGFDIYLPENISGGTVTIEDNMGNIVKKFPVDSMASGIHTFEWDGSNDGGSRAAAGAYHAKIVYITDNGKSGASTNGTYPIESVRFDNGEPLLKLGSQYVPMTRIKEIYKGRT